MVLLTSIGLGAMHVLSCPAQPYIPIFLIVIGLSSILSLLLTYTHHSMEEGTASVLTSTCLTLLHFFNVCWFTSGSVWVYAIYPPSYNVFDGQRYCQKTLYQFAFWFTNIYWIALVAVFLCGGLCLFLTCFKLAFRGSYLSNSPRRWYGVAGDV